MRISVTRDPVVESVHHVDAVVADQAGTRLTWGDADRPTLARSGLKPIQALPLIRTGAADRFMVSDDELALACASHNAEPGHVSAVEGWLARIGLAPSDLECGPALPRITNDLTAHLRAGRGQEPICNNCSGKHAGFLSVAQHLGIDHRGYLEPAHPVQRLVSEAISEFCRVDLSGQTPGRDGCGIPTWSIPLSDLAGAMARLVDPVDLDGSWAEPARRLAAVLPSRAWLMSGTDRHEVVVAGRATEPVIIKAGAEGVFMAALPERGLGLAVKAADGAARAAEVAISSVLAHLGALPGDAVAKPVTNVAGLVVGSVAPVGDAPATVG